MIKKKYLDIFLDYNIEDNKINRNVVKCLIKAMCQRDYARIEGQYYIYDESMFNYLISKYEKFKTFFDFFYSLKTDIILMFVYLVESKINNKKLHFNAYFCPGYSDDGGYKDHLGNTTIKKLAILGDLSTFLEKEQIPYRIDCYYCDSYIENCSFEKNKNWLKQLEYNRDLFVKEASKYFDKEFIHFTSEMEVFKNEKDYAGHIDYEIVNNIPKKVYNSFYIANEVFYNKLNFSQERIRERNDILATMYIMVSNYINGLESGIYLPMENMYDREKIIASNNTCTMYLNQGLVKKNEK